MRMVNTCVLVALAVAWGYPSAAAVIFVDNRLPGDCVGAYSIARRDNSGTDGTAYNTPQKAADVVNPGDTVLFRQGTYRVPPGAKARDAQPVMEVLRSGTKAHPITFGNYNGEEVILSGADDSGVPYRKCVIRLGAEPRDAADAAGAGVSYVTVEGLIVEKATGTGLLLCGATDRIHYPPEYPARSVTIRNVTARHITHSLRGIGKGISSKGTTWDCTIENCEAYGNTGSGIGFSAVSKGFNGHPTLIPGVPFADDDKLSAAHHCVIRNCLVHDNLHPADARDTDGIGCAMMYRCRVENNVVYGNGDDGIDIYSSVECTVQGNIIFGQPNGPHGNGCGLKFSAGGGGKHRILGNIAFSNGAYNYEGSDSQARFRHYYPSKVCNNVAVGGGKAGFLWGVTYDRTPACYEKACLRNNVALRNNGHDFAAERGRWADYTDSDYNFISDPEGLAALRGIRQDLHSLQGADAGLGDRAPVVDTAFQPGWTIRQKLEHIRKQVREAFTPRPGSPLVNAGTVVAGCHNPDAGDASGDGRAWYGKAPDIGAMETGGGTAAANARPKD